MRLHSERDVHVLPQPAHLGANSCSLKQVRPLNRKSRMLAAFEFIATLSAVLFCGAAIYINVAEHPARMGCDTKTAATVWAPSYKRATFMQASLAIVGFLAGAAVWLLGSGRIWLVGALLIGLVVPFTLLVIAPTNRRLLEPGRDLTSKETRALLEKWGKLHAVRSILSLLASVIYVGLLVGVV